MSPDRTTLLVQERAAGRLVRVDVASGAVTRLDTPNGSDGLAMALLADPANAASALVLVGHSENPVVPPLNPPVNGAVYRIGIAEGGWQPVLEAGFDGIGFFVDAAGTGAYTWRDGVEHIDFATGGRERLDRCADVEALMIEPSGASAFRQSVIPRGPHMDASANLIRCDLTTGEMSSRTIGSRQESLAVGCDGERLYRAREYFSGEGAAVGAATVLYDVLEPTTLETVASLGAMASVPELRAPGGPATAASDCTSVWFGTPSGVFAYDAGTRTARRVVEGGATITHMAMGDRTGTVIVAGGTAASDGPFRYDLATGEFEDLFPDGGEFGDWVSTLATSPHARALWIAVSPYGHSYYPPYAVGDARVDRVDLVTGLVSRGATLADTHVLSLSTCGEPSRVFGIGTTWTADGSETAGLFELRDSVLRSVRALDGEPNIYATLFSGPGQGRLVMSHDCDTAYVLGDHVYAARVGGGSPRVASETSGDAAVLDPRQDLLVVADGLTLYGLDLRDNTRSELALLTEGVLDLTMTEDGKVLWTGATSLGLGMIDLVNGTSARLWEGAGAYGR